MHVRENAQKINQLEKSGQSAKIKSIIADNVKVAVKVGTFDNIVFELNKNALGDKKIEEIDFMFMNADNTVANSFKDAMELFVKYMESRL